jgi:hypothetical protein
MISFCIFDELVCKLCHSERLIVPILLALLSRSTHLCFTKSEPDRLTSKNARAVLFNYDVDTGIGQCFLRIWLLPPEIPINDPITLYKEAKILRGQVSGNLKLCPPA